MAKYSAVTPKSILPNDWFDTTIFISFRKLLVGNSFEVKSSNNTII